MAEGKVLSSIGPGWVRRVMQRAYSQGISIFRTGGLGLAWDDLRAPLTGQQLTISAGRLDYDFTQCVVGFSATARYPQEPIAMTFEFQHAKYLGGAVTPHLHWVQAKNAIPNWLIAYRWYNNGSDPTGAFTLAIPDSSIFTYSSGSIMQLTNWLPIAAPANETLSSVLDVILYRDSANASTLFTGADPYTGSAAAKEFDIHYQRDSIGSVTKSTKDAV